jgi:hypothetical protein
MPYVLKRGTIHGKPYKCGDFVPGGKGDLAEMEASGAVEWVESPPREPKPKPKATPRPRSSKAVK